MFFEVDLGTESRAIWERKVRGYLALATSGAFSQDFQQAQFRVLAVTTSDRRLESLRVATRKVTEKVFWFTTFESIQQAGFWSAVWLRPSGDKLQALV